MINEKSNLSVESPSKHSGKTLALKTPEKKQNRKRKPSASIESKISNSDLPENKKQKQEGFSLQTYKSQLDPGREEEKKTKPDKDDLKILTLREKIE